MEAALKLKPVAEDLAQLSRKPRHGKNRSHLKLVWENPGLSAGKHREKPGVKLRPVSGQTLYAYVGGNPLMRFDPDGLTQEQINDAIAFARKYFSDLPIPKACEISVLDIPGANGQTRIFRDWWNGKINGEFEIELDDKYLKDLDQRGMEKLLQTIVHEGIHASDLERAAREDPKVHPWVGREARERIKGFKEKYFKEVVIQYL